VVDAVVRTLRRKIGVHAAELRSVRGVVDRLVDAG